MKANQKVFILGERKGKKLHSITFELIAEGRKLADKLGTELYCILLGQYPADEVQSLGQYGADTILFWDHGIIAVHPTEIYLPIIRKLIAEYRPCIFLFGATPLGKDLAPRIATMERTSLLTDCYILNVDENAFLQGTKFIYNGQASATFLCSYGRPQMATVLPGVVDITDPDKGRGVKIIGIPFEFSQENQPITKIIDFCKGDPERVDLTEADIIVEGGAGVGSKEHFRLIKELADTLNGSIGGTRVAVDRGWIDIRRQIGISGKSVAPKILIACGVSGSIQHQAGIRASKMISINTDKNAPIFKKSDLAIQGNLHEIIPLLIEKIKVARNSQRKQSSL